MIYTSYFAMIPKFPEGVKFVSIARYMPKWLNIDVPTYTALVPSYNTLMDYKNNPDELKYIERYTKENLDKLDCDKVYKELDGCVLLCYEGIGKFCHRHLVSKWFRDHGYDCREVEVK